MSLCYEQKFFEEKRRVQGEMSSIVEDIRHASKEDAIEKLGERTKVTIERLYNRFQRVLPVQLSCVNLVRMLLGSGDYA